MKHVKLITFDIFGTLIDWRSYVEAAFPGRYADFLEASAVRQLPQASVLPYRKLLAEVVRDLTPRSGHEFNRDQYTLEQQTFFADGFGCAPPFADSRAIQQLSTMCLLGCASNSDYRHVIDVQKNLGCLFDLTVLAEDLGCYKPHTEAWEQIEHTVTRKLGYEKRSWLHVSAYVDFDLEPAKSRGIHTCFVERPGGSSRSEAERLKPDFIVSDLWELVHTVAGINGASVRYEVRAVCKDEATKKDFVEWVLREQGPKLLQVRGCQRFQVLEETPEIVRCDYLFTSHAALDNYLSGSAQELHRQGRERYSEEQVRFERSELSVLSGFAQRNRYDFPGIQPVKG